VNDSATIGYQELPAGGRPASEGFYRWHEFYAFAQDEWRIRDNLTLTFEFATSIRVTSSVLERKLNGRSWPLTATARYSGWAPFRKADANNLMRGWLQLESAHGQKGIIGFFTGGDKLVVSGGYSRTYDPVFMNLIVNMAASVSLRFYLQVFSPSGAYVAIRDTTVPDLSQANLFTRTVVSADLRSPAYRSKLL